MTEKNDKEVNSIEYASQRIRELEMDLAQSKVAQVESECQNQSLQHQINALLAKNASSQTSNNISSSNPWRVKWDNVVNNIPSVAQTLPSFQSHISDIANQLQSFDESK